MRKAAATFAADFLSTMTALFMAIIAFVVSKALTLFTVELKVAPFVLNDNRQRVTKAIVDDLTPFGLDNSDLQAALKGVFGDKLLTAPNPGASEDAELFRAMGLPAPEPDALARVIQRPR